MAGPPGPPQEVLQLRAPDRLRRHPNPFCKQLEEHPQAVVVQRARRLDDLRRGMHIPRLENLNQFALKIRRQVIHWTGV